jgi:SAM-dependent methyltransferase
MAQDRPPFLPLFFVSAAAIAFEIQLTRYFAIASWSEYGYWIISIVMVGLSASGVALSLFKDFFLSRLGRWGFWIPLALIAMGVLGFWAVTLIPFNPLEFQNPELWLGQLLNVGKYYLALFPFFFLSGLFIGLSFTSFPGQIPRLYAADLVGAACGALGMLLAMNSLHPFYLLAASLPLLFLAAGLSSPSRSSRWVLGLLFLLTGEAGVFKLNQADYCQYKAIYPALHVEGSRVVQQDHLPRGLYTVLDDFTERLDIDLSNNYSLLGVEGPPASLGLYQDGNRVCALPFKGWPVEVHYAKASLDSLPYLLRPGARTLLLGTRGGFKFPELLSQGVSQITALEPDPFLYSLISDRQKFGGDWLLNPSITFLRQPPLPYLKNHPEPFDIIDLSAEFLDQGEGNRLAFAQETLRAYYQTLKPGGILSIPASIRELTVYALKTLESARAALASLGVEDPQAHLLLYRSAWNCRVLVFKDPLDPKDLKKIESFCSDRSFDISYFKGIEPKGREVWNEIPPSSFDARPDRTHKLVSQDALLGESLQLLSDEGPTYIRDHFFNLKPSTWDRPFFYSILRGSRLRAILKNLSIIPREEIGWLVNLAVLTQAIVFALLILLTPLVRRRSGGSPAGRRILYFGGLGLGFLFIEIDLIEKASLLLGDKTLAFSLVLCGMLFFSGLGSGFGGKSKTRPVDGLKTAMGLVLPWLILAFFFLNPFLSALLPLGTPVKCLVLLLLLAPLAFGLGMPFSLGLSALPSKNLSAIPWAWALNGAFSVAATPLANLVAVSSGYNRLLLLSLILYGLVGLTFPWKDER